MWSITIAEKQVPDSEQSVEWQVACKQTHQPVSGEHERLYSVVLQVFVRRWTRSLQDPAQHGSVKQDPLLHDTSQQAHTENHTVHILH